MKSGFSTIERQDIIQQVSPSIADRAIPLDSITIVPLELPPVEESTQIPIIGSVVSELSLFSFEQLKITSVNNNNTIFFIRINLWFQ